MVQILNVLFTAVFLFSSRVFIQPRLLHMLTHHSSVRSLIKVFLETFKLTLGFGLVWGLSGVLCLGNYFGMYVSSKV